MIDYNKEIKFNLLDKVNITELKRKGIVIGILINHYGVRYDVRYFDHAKVQEVYFFSNELEIVK